LHHVRCGSVIEIPTKGPIVQDVIERSIDIAAPLARVWHLVTEPGWWVHSDTTGDREPGAVTVREHEGTYYPVEVVALEPQSYASFRWASTFASTDAEASALVAGHTTLIEFRLAELDGAVRVTVTESGFAALDATEEVRAHGYAMNNDGWTQELARLKTLVEELADA
jgi:uncharacterized protein YndB with AHSA1/START domain